MATKHLPIKDDLRGEVVDRWTLIREVGRGKNGVVYEGHDVIESNVIDRVAVKLIPAENLRPEWRTEIRKAVLLDGVDQVVVYRSSLQLTLKSREYAAIASRFEHGPSLRDYMQRFPLNITISFIDNLLEQIGRAHV